MEADPKETAEKPEEREYLDYIPVDVVQRILTCPQRRAAKLAELAAEEAAASVDSEVQDMTKVMAQENRWAPIGCDVFNAGDVIAFIRSKNPSY